MILENDDMRKADPSMANLFIQLKSSQIDETIESINKK